MLALELRKLGSDFRYINNSKIKTVTLKKAIGCEGKASLQSVGFNKSQSSLEKAFALLDDHYGREKEQF